MQKNAPQEPRQHINYFRGDQARGISAPNLLKRCSFVDHIVGTRGHRTAFTSVSLSPDIHRKFGECL